MNEIDRISRRALSRRIFKHRMAMRSWILLGITLSSALALVGFMLFGPSLRPEDDRHDHFVAALWPPSGEPGKSLHFIKTPAYLYQDPSRPLTWHVCTATVCGRFYEADGDEEKSK
jgi:hypothetical protein